MDVRVAASRAQGTFARPGVVRQGWYLRRRRDLHRALPILWSTALDDLKLMERFGWTAAYAASAAALERYAGFVERLPAW
jgi:hypothetical protein